VTPTSTPSNTPTVTNTNSFTFTPTVTFTFTPTFTFTNTLTPTYSFTPTNSFTPSFTPTITWTPTVTLTPTITSTPTPTGSVTNTPTPNAALVLSDNFFDPTKKTLGIDLRVDQPGQCKVMVFNIIGQQVVKLLDQYENAGNFSLSWDGKNRSGEIVGNAVYFVVTVQPSGRLVRQVIVLK
jgi:hypothetical protein